MLWNHLKLDIINCIKNCRKALIAVALIKKRSGKNMCNCQYIETGTPICKADKRLRNCNTSICCSFCPSLEFCERVCGIILFEQEY